jgi:predicted AlkP superfamily phosphohydrolase/phosphomutase
MTSPSSSGRVLVLGLDMGDGGLIRHWVRQRRLPHFEALQSAGASLSLESTAQVLHTSTWPTFATGTLPGRHGVYYPYQPKPGHQLAQYIEPDQYGAETLWKLASDRERPTVVYDIPETFPEAEFRGRAIFDWGTWAWYGTPCAQPPELLAQIKSRFGAYPLGFEAKRLGLGVPDHIEERLSRSVRYKATTARWLLENSDWALAVVGFCETHPAGHYLWPRGADSVDSTDASSFEPLYRVYAEVDEALGVLRASVPSDTTVIVVSGDGVRPNRCGWHLLPPLMERLGYLTSKGGGGGAAADARPAAPSLVGRAHQLIPGSAKRLVTDSLPWRLRDRLGVWLQTRSIDWSRTRAFTLPTDLEGCIRINVKGREPFGIVEPGGQYVDVCQEIRARLEELENPATGRPAVRRVWLRNEVFPGPRQEQLPDLIVTWNDEAPLEAVVSPRIGSIAGVNPDSRTGTHSTDGFALAAGPGIQGGTDGQGHLADVSCTILARLGIDPLPPLDGRPLPALTGRTRASSTLSSH